MPSSGEDTEQAVSSLWRDTLVPELDGRGIWSEHYSSLKAAGEPWRALKPQYCLERSGAQRAGEFKAALKSKPWLLQKGCLATEDSRPSNSRPSKKFQAEQSILPSSARIRYFGPRRFRSACWVTKTLRKNAVIPVSDFCTSSSASLSTISQVGAESAPATWSGRPCHDVSWRIRSAPACSAGT